MSKIGIMTFCNEKNYGAQLQAYALQSAINTLGHESEFIRYCEPKKELQSKNKHSYLKSLKSVHFSLRN